MLLAASDAQAISEPAAVAFFLFVATLGAYLVGVFKASSVNGPSRSGGKDTALACVMAGATGLFIHLSISSLLLQFLMQRHNISSSTPIAQIPGNLTTLADACGRIGLIAAIIAMNQRIMHRVITLGIGVKRLTPGLARGIIGALITMPLMFATLQICEWVMRYFEKNTHQVHPLLTTLGDTPGRAQRLLIMGTITVLAPISEELFFRGCMQTFFVEMFSRFARDRSLPEAACQPTSQTRWPAIACTALLFAAIHPMWSWAPIFVLAICLGYAYERTGNLWVPITIHAAFNATSTVVFLATR